MANAFKPNVPFTTALVVLKPTYTSVAGVRTKALPALADGIQIFGSFKTYGGTEKVVDGLYSIADTAVVETWYRPDITSDCVIAIAETGAQYQILNEPENINLRNQYLRFKVQRIKGGA